MPRISVFVDKVLLENIKNLSKETGKSSSRISSELIELGYKVKSLQSDKKTNQQEEKMAELIEQHTAFLLRLIAINSDIFRCVRNEKSKYSDKETKDALDLIKSEAAAYIDGFIGKNQ